LFWNLQQGEWIEQGRTLEEEVELINSSTDDPGQKEEPEESLTPSGGGGDGSNEYDDRPLEEGPLEVEE
jgi:hypothetical protein